MKKILEGDKREWIFGDHFESLLCEKGFASCFDTNDTSKVRAYLKKTIISCILQSTVDTANDKEKEPTNQASKPKTKMVITRD